MKLQDGRGSGREAAVNSSNRVAAASVGRTEENAQCQRGDAYFIGSGNLTITSASESALLLIVNNDTRTFQINELTYVVDTATGTSAAGNATFVFNPGSGGTIVSSGSAVTPANLNLDSSKTSSLEVYSGGTGLTFAESTADGAIIQDGERVNFIPARSTILLPPGSSVGYGWQPASGNTSQRVAVALYGNFQTEDF